MTPERRLHPRARAYRPVRLHPRGSPAVIETLTKDLSVCGLRCLCPKPVPVGLPVNVELVLGQGQEPLFLEGKAVWFRTLPDSEQYDLGVSFLDLSEQKRRRLSVYFDSVAAVPA
ncbi:MAG: PilZ domain-containing protein [Candidatus Omnitrophica bacterium]|nr:PilZ domain-containing protein [Candidatus Omnitrophota bacterium]